MSTHETYEREWVKCGKPACKSCPHGPYWYAYRTTRKGKVVKRYIGKELPVEAKLQLYGTERWRGRVKGIKDLEQQLNPDE